MKLRGTRTTESYNLTRPGNFVSSKEIVPVKFFPDKILQQTTYCKISESLNHIKEDPQKTN